MISFCRYFDFFKIMETVRFSLISLVRLSKVGGNESPFSLSFSSGDIKSMDRVASSTVDHDTEDISVANFAYSL